MIEVERQRLLDVVANAYADFRAADPTTSRQAAYENGLRFAPLVLERLGIDEREVTDGVWVVTVAAFDG